MQEHPQFRSRTYHSTDGKSLAYHRTVIIALTVVGFILWSTCIGVPAGFCFSTMYSTDYFNGFLLVVVNSAYIICAFQTLSLITSDNFPTAGSLKSLRNLISLSWAAALVGFSVFISSTLHFAIIDRRPVAFGCSFSVFWSIFVVSWITIYYRKCCNVLAKAENFSGDPGAAFGSSSPPTMTTTAYPVETSEAACQIQILTESQQQQLQQRLQKLQQQQQQLQQQQQQLQQQQQQQNQVIMINDTQQGVHYIHRPLGSDTAASAPSFVYLPQSSDALGSTL
ncbi:hairy/enhancer-of-split related with YRPW motif protein-like [Macrobrachium nipponense]|uniref:hairy/enhancer-of-split related with YRPW motif protein-like n=1 Tax=Macrobrachium nipponense TaxID=159736 RepID=UPI0030C80436